MKIKRIKLNALSAEGLRQKEMNAIVGGTRICSCSCYYANSGGSSSSDNKNANYALGDGGGVSYHSSFPSKIQNSQYTELNCTFKGTVL